MEIFYPDSYLGDDNGCEADKKTDGGVARPPGNNTTRGRPERPNCGTCRMSRPEDSGGYFGGYIGPGGEV